MHAPQRHGPDRRTQTTRRSIPQPSLMPLDLRLPAVGHVLIGPLFNEPMRIETVRQVGTNAWILGLVGTHCGLWRWRATSPEAIRAPPPMGRRHRHSLGPAKRSRQPMTHWLRRMLVRVRCAAHDAQCDEPRSSTRITRQSGVEEATAVLRVATAYGEASVTDAKHRAAPPQSTSLDKRRE